MKTLNSNISALKKNNTEKNIKTKNQKNNMPKTKKLQKQIEKKLDQLQELLDHISEDND